MTRRKTKNIIFPLYLVFFIIFIAFGFLILKKSFNSARCANTLSCKESLELSVNNDEAAIFEGEKIDPPNIDLSADFNQPDVLGSETDSSEKHIYVDLSTETLKAFQGDKLFMEARISAGKWFPTPTGDFTIWRKIRSTKMSGGEGADYYYLPNVPFVMFFSNSMVAGGRGFSLHGAYWHDNFGHAMSHGCVNMRIIDAQKLYYWANPQTTDNQISSKPGETGTIITIYGKAP